MRRQVAPAAVAEGDEPNVKVRLGCASNGAHAARTTAAASARRTTPIYIGADDGRGHHRGRGPRGVVPLGAAWDRRRPRADAASPLPPAARRRRRDPGVNLDW